MSAKEMQQIRFDFLGGINGGGGRTGGNANAAESGDAFAQILDQQLARRADAGATRRSTDARGRADAGERSESPRPQAVKRREQKHAAAGPAPAKTETAKPAPKPKAPEKLAAEDTGCAKPATQPRDDTDPAAETATAAPAAGGNTAAGGTTEAEGKGDGPGADAEQQPGDGQQQASDGAEQSETAEADLDLLAMLAVPLPLQTLAIDSDASAEPAALAGGGEAAAAALQAELAARLAGSIDLTAAAAAADAKGQAVQAKSGGLKFGAVLNTQTGAAQTGATDPLATLQAVAAELATAADPLAQATPGGGKLRDAATTPSKAREAAEDKAAATANPAPNGKAAAAIIQPMNRAAAVTWSGITPRNELSESMALQAGAGFAADDAEFSNWSQVLGSGAAGLGSHLAARQSAFMAQLKQDLQNLPAHEQIAVQIKNAMQNGNSRLTVALHPVELGRVEVKLDIDKDKNVTATIVVDRPATLDLLRNDAKALERALQDAGLQTDSGSLSFNLRDGSGQTAGNAQNGTGTGGGSGPGNGGGGSEVKAEPVRASVIATADGYVDLET